MRGWLVGCVLLLASTALAQTDDAKSNAEALNKLAVEAYERGDLAGAVAQWQAAQRIHPTWKYALNLAGTLPKLERWKEAWSAAEKAEALAIPREHAKQLLTIRQQIERKLLAEYARLELTVVPPDATVLAGGKPWGDTRWRWVKGEKITLEITRVGYEPHKSVWTYSVGTVKRKTVSLRRAIARGTLLVEGTPKDAIVRVNDKPIGALPSAPKQLKPGRYEIRIDKDGYVPYKTELDVTAGKTRRLTVDLKPTVTVSKSSGPSGLSIAGWTGAGLGVAALGAGVGMFLWADQAAKDSNRLAENPTDPDYSNYLAEHEALEADYDTRQTAGVALVVVGAAAAVTGAVLLVLDKTGDAPKTSVAPVPLEGGGGLSAVVTF